MKSNAFRVGNANLKGRKTKRLKCGCCTAINFREKELEKEAQKYMKETKGYVYYHWSS